MIVVFVGWGWAVQWGELFGPLVEWRGYPFTAVCIILLVMVRVRVCVCV